MHSGIYVCLWLFITIHLNRFVTDTLWRLKINCIHSNENSTDIQHDWFMPIQYKTIQTSNKLDLWPECLEIEFLNSNFNLKLKWFALNKWISFFFVWFFRWRRILLWSYFFVDVRLIFSFHYFYFVSLMEFNPFVPQIISRLYIIVDNFSEKIIMMKSLLKIFVQSKCQRKWNRKEFAQGHPQHWVEMTATL